MAVTTVAQFAAELNRPAGMLLEQLQSAGVAKKSPDDALTDTDKERLLEFWQGVVARTGLQVHCHERFEGLRETAAQLYMHETGHSWRPAGGSRLSHDANATSAVVQGREFLRARAESKRKAAMPAGRPVVFAGGRQSFPTTDEAKQFGENIWATLDKVREHVAEMVLVHGGDSKGADRLASAWAESRRVPQIAFGLDTRLGQRAGFRRNEQMLSLDPRFVVAFPGNGVLERLVIQAKERRIQVVDRRGPLGTNPKRAAAPAA